MVSLLPTAAQHNSNKPYEHSDPKNNDDVGDDDDDVSRALFRRILAGTLEHYHSHYLYDDDDDYADDGLKHMLWFRSLFECVFKIPQGTDCGLLLRLMYICQAKTLFRYKLPCLRYCSCYVT